MINEKLIQKENGLFKKVREYHNDVKTGNKALVLEEIQNTTITTTAGNVFDADEVSQNRMQRAIHVMNYRGSSTTSWKLANNTILEVTIEELDEALALAGENQTQLWFN